MNNQQSIIFYYPRKIQSPSPFLLKWKKIGLFFQFFYFLLTCLLLLKLFPTCVIAYTSFYPSYCYCSCSSTSNIRKKVNHPFVSIKKFTTSVATPTMSSWNSVTMVKAMTNSLDKNSATATRAVEPWILRNIVQNASSKEQQEEHTIDLKGIIWLEHINLVVGCKELANYFYVDFLGCTPDSSTSSFHVNLGQQQFHLAEPKTRPKGMESYTSIDAHDDDGTIAQAIYGSIGLTVPNLNAIRERISDARTILDGTEFDILWDGFTANSNSNDSSLISTSKMLSVRCPWGNIYHLYDMSIDVSEEVATSATHVSEESRQAKMVSMHQHGGIYGPHRMAVRGKPGIRFIEFLCREGTSCDIGSFYKDIMDCTIHPLMNSAITTETTKKQNDKSEIIVTTDSCPGVVVRVGPGIHFVFRERKSNVATEIVDAHVLKMKGVHVCLYVDRFYEKYQKLQQRHMIWTNPRFVHLDTCHTWTEAMQSRTFRFKDIVAADPADTKNRNENDDYSQSAYKHLIELEHETRSTTHGQYLKVPNYEPR